jgi:hypothetical protein
LEGHFAQMQTDFNTIKQSTQENWFQADANKVAMPQEISELLRKSEKLKTFNLLLGRPQREHEGVDVSELQYSVDERDGVRSDKGLSNGTYLIFPKRGGFKVPNIVGVEVFRNDTRVVRQGYKREIDWADPIRGEITEFSEHSRQRLAFIANNTLIVFLSMLTLTYPRHFPMDGRVCKWHFDRFMDAMKRKFGEFEWLWFGEFQERDAWHTHIVTNIDMSQHGNYITKYRKGRKQQYVTVKELHDWASKQWLNIVHKRLTLYQDKRGKIFNKQSCDGSRKMVAEWWPDRNYQRMKDAYRSGISFEPVRKEDGLKRYVVKYATKMEQKDVPPGFTHVGRFWGCSKGVADIKPVAKLVGTEAMIKSVLATLEVHQAVKALVKLPKVLFNVGKVMVQDMDMVKEVFVSLETFRKHATWREKFKRNLFELKFVTYNDIMRVFNELRFNAYSEIDFDTYCKEMEGQY